MLLLVLAGLWVLVLEDEVDLFCMSNWSVTLAFGLTLLVAPHLSGPNMIT